MFAELASLIKLVKALDGRLKKVENIKGGKGVKVLNSPGGLSVFAAVPQGGDSRARTGSTANALVLTNVQATQDTDDWERAVDRRAVTVKVVADIQYDTTDHKITMRTRTFTFDSAGALAEISEESDPLTLITTAVPGVAAEV